LIDDVVRAAQGHERVEVVAELAPLPRVVGDPLAFRRILENLIANAVDSLESRPGRITVAASAVHDAREQPVVRITVTDTGRGMSADEAKRIFDDFYTTKEGGTGLGLSIVRRLVMDLHGTVNVESTPGRGTRMIVDIPADRR
jgi:two-component system nitrogen regulation sensor histidine kinase NtrY